VSGKKFTDSNKWKKQFFRNLSLEGKLAWFYLTDNCDHAGIWIVDVDTFNFQSGLRLTLQNILDIFKNHVVLFDNGERLWLKTYYSFQYEDAKDTFSAKISALKRLKKYGLDAYLSSDCPHTLSTDPSHTDTTLNPDSMESTIISNIIIKGISNIPLPKNEESDKISIEPTPVPKIKSPPRPVFDFEEIYKLYPRKLGKAEGISRLKKTIFTPEDFDALKLAVENYSKHCASQGTEEKYIKHFSSFVGTQDKPHWRDWINYSVSNAKPKHDYSFLLEEDVL
jgi:hypothetical protein